MAVFMATALIVGSVRTAPIKYANAASVTVDSVALGYAHSALIAKNGDLYCWGNNDSGQVGNGSDEQQDKPVKVLSNVVSAALGEAHSAAITKNGDLYCWGANDSGQLGDGSGEDKDKPVKVLSNIASVALGYTHSAANW